MAHFVICPYCKKRFDRDKEPYAKINSRRYAHADCALREQTKNPDLKKVEIIDPSDFVTCKYCKQIFNKSKEPFKVFSNGKYAHQKCFDLEQNRELTDKDKLERYIMGLFQTDYVYARIQKQITDFVTNHGYTYSGIQKALIYYYEVTKHPFSEEKANGGIGIVPYVYNKAYQYYYSIWEAQQKQKDIVAEIEKYTPKTIQVYIQNPERKVKKRKLFSFLDQEE